MNGFVWVLESHSRLCGLTWRRLHSHHLIDLEIFDWPHSVHSNRFVCFHFSCMGKISHYLENVLKLFIIVQFFISKNNWHFNRSVSTFEIHPIIMASLLIMSFSFLISVKYSICPTFLQNSLKTPERCLFRLRWCWDCFHIVLLCDFPLHVVRLKGNTPFDIRSLIQSIQFDERCIKQCSLPAY